MVDASDVGQQAGFQVLVAWGCRLAGTVVAMIAFVNFARAVSQNPRSWMSSFATSILIEGSAIARSN